MFRGIYKLLKMTAVLSYKEKDVRNAVIMSPIDLSLLTVRETIDLLMGTIGSDERIAKAMKKFAEELNKEELTDEERAEIASILDDFFAQMNKSKA
jgi:hypothetical protein